MDIFPEIAFLITLEVVFIQKEMYLPFQMLAINELIILNALILSSPGSLWYR